MTDKFLFLPGKKNPPCNKTWHARLRMETESRRDLLLIALGEAALVAFREGVASSRTKSPNVLEPIYPLLAGLLSQWAAARQKAAFPPQVAKPPQ